MTVINRKALKTRPSGGDRKDERQKLYNDKVYKSVRALKRQNTPLCELCEEVGLTTASEHTHHILSPFDRDISEGEKYRRLRSYNNLQSLCNIHHQIVHQTASKEQIQQLQSRIDRINELKNIE